MGKCEICKKNEAAIRLKLEQDSSGEKKSVCLSCAWKHGGSEVQQELRRATINEQNVEAFTQVVNWMMQQNQAINGQDVPMDFETLQAFLSHVQILNFDNMQEDCSNMLKMFGEELNQEQSVEEVSEEGQEEEQSNLLSIKKIFGSTSRESEEKSEKKIKKRKLKFLNQYGLDLTARAAQGELDRVVGREKELERVIQILNRRNKNNPVLLGEPGVGKTAIAESLALRIVEGKVPAKLRDMRVFLLDMTALVAGTQFRGQFENRMKNVVEEAGGEGNIILVIDELHMIMGAGDGEGAMNAANILKPALAKGSIRILGSTTLSEYHKTIEKDTALERRFQQVRVEEPSAAETLEILKGVRGYYEKHHHVFYTDEVLETAVRYAQRYIHDRFFPDKAIDLLDEAGSKSNLEQRLLSQEKDLQQKQAELQERIEQKNAEIEQSGEAEPLKLYEEKAHIQEQLAQVEAEWKQLQEQIHPITLTKEDIASVVEMWTGIPVRSITEEESEKLLELEKRLQNRVIGQQDAVLSLSSAIRRHRAGFGKQGKPASFLFVGPTGVGKTELAKAVTEVLFDDEKAMIRLDMSEFMEAHSVSKIIGAPPGYIGFDEGGQLTEKIRRHPYSVLLLDEIEKAHQDVYNILLQILDEGHLTDSQGRKVNFSNCLILMTSNVGTGGQNTSIGFGHSLDQGRESQVMKALEQGFRPEFLNRIDEIIVFNTLKPEELRQICRLMMKEVEQVLKRMDIQLKCSDQALDWLVQQGYQVKYGARPLRKTIRRKLEDVLADAYLKGMLAGCSKVCVDWKGADHLELEYKAD